MQLSEIVDVARYAIDPASGAEYDALVDSARAGLAESGVCVLEGFVRRDAIDRIVADREDLSRRSEDDRLVGRGPGNAQCVHGHAVNDFATGW